MESIRDVFQSGKTHAIGTGPRVEIEEFSLYDIAGIILEVETNAKETCSVTNK